MLTCISIVPTNAMKVSIDKEETETVSYDGVIEGELNLVSIYGTHPVECGLALYEYETHMDGPYATGKFFARSPTGTISADLAPNALAASS